MRWCPSKGISLSHPTDGGHPASRRVGLHLAAHFMLPFPNDTDDAVRPNAPTRLRLLSKMAFARSAIRRVFAEAIVNSVFVMVVHVIAHQPTEVRFVECDHVIEDLAPATSHPSLRDSILPRCLYARSFGFQPRCLQERDDLVIEC